MCELAGVTPLTLLSLMHVGRSRIATHYKIRHFQRLLSSGFFLNHFNAFKKIPGLSEVLPTNFPFSIYGNLTS